MFIFIKFVMSICCFLILNACSYTDRIHYEDEVDTPDILIQAPQGGDADYGLDQQAVQHAEQHQPDDLEKSIQSQPARKAMDVDTVATEEHQEKSVQPTKTTKPPIEKQQMKKPVLKKSPSRQESALEVDDPLLDEVQP